MPFISYTIQRAPSSHFLHTEWAVLMHIRLGLSPKPHTSILFVHGTTKVKIYFVTDKNEVQEKLCHFCFCWNSA